MPNVTPSPLSATKRVNRYEFVRIALSSERGTIRGKRGTSPKVPPVPPPVRSRKISRAHSLRDTSATYEVDGPSVGGSETTAEEGSPRIEDSHLPRHPTGRSSLLFPRDASSLPSPSVPPSSLSAFRPISQSTWPSTSTLSCIAATTATTNSRIY